MRNLGLALLCGLSLCACGSDDDAPTPGSGSGGNSNTGGASGEGGTEFMPMPVAGSQCNAVVQRFPILASPHVDVCSVLTPEENPPSSGPHYSRWAAFDIYDQTLPRGYWLHAMEHGAVVVAHNCAGADCTGQIAEAKTWAGTLPVDPKCVNLGEIERRFVMTPDPLLARPWAAVAWGVTLLSDCFEPEIFMDFYQANYGKAPEDFCNQGTNLKDDAGDLAIDPNCGTAPADGGSTASDAAGSATDAASAG